MTGGRTERPMSMGTNGQGLKSWLLLFLASLSDVFSFLSLSFSIHYMGMIIGSLLGLLPTA